MASERDGCPEGEDQTDAGDGGDRDPAQVASDVVEIVHGGGGAGSAIASLDGSGCATAWSAGGLGTRGADPGGLLDVATERSADGRVGCAGLGSGQAIFAAALASPTLRSSRALGSVRATSSSA